ncbi:MAG: hypothetical protein IMF06_14200 [Proteobacteria bacterium]|nr:hypothetical protein [Pseudomonadota bacterium]
MNKSGSKTSLGQQLALVAAGLCLIIGLAMVTLGAISSRHLQLSQQEEYGTALAQLMATRISTALETGDLLSIAASLQRFVANSTAAQIEIFDVEGNELGQAGQAIGQNLSQYAASVRIDNDIAGEVRITLNGDAAQAAHLRLVLSLLGLTILLSLAAYGASRHMGQRLADRLIKLAKTVSTDGQDTSGEQPPINEVDLLEKNIQALPMDLLRTRGSVAQRDENYQTTAVLYLHLSSLMDYVDTLDQHSLQRYTNRLHQVLYASAGFYAGEIHVTRQFGVAIYFNGNTSAGSAAFRAASCGWLIQNVCRALEKQITLSIAISMAISQSELGIGDGEDIYPGLYMQHTIDELQILCASKPPKILLAPVICEDIDIAGRLEHEETELRDYAMLTGFEGPYQDLLERQFRLIWKRLTGAE